MLSVQSWFIRSCLAYLGFGVKDCQYEYDNFDKGSIWAHMKTDKCQVIWRMPLNQACDR